MKYLVSIWIEDLEVEANSAKEAEDIAGCEVDNALARLGIRTDYVEVAQP